MGRRSIFPALSRSGFILPQFPRIDRSNPLTRGLVFCAVPYGNSYIDAVTGVVGTRHGTLTSGIQSRRGGFSAPHQAPRSLEATASGGGDYVSWPQSSTLRGGDFVASAAQSIFALGGVNSPSDGNGYYMGGNTDGTTTGTGMALCIDSYSYSINRGSVGISNYSVQVWSDGQSGLGTSFGDKTHFFGVCANNTDVTTYFNRKSFFAAGQFNAGSAVTTRQAYVHTSSQSGVSVTGSQKSYVELLLIYNRFVSLREYQDLYDQSGQQVLAPPSDIAYFMPSFGAGANLFTADTYARASVTAALTSGITPVAALQAQASVAAALTTAFNLATSAQAVASTSASLTTGIALASATAARASVTVALTTGINLAAVVSAQASVTASLGNAASLAATAGAQASVTASLTTGIPLASSAVASASVTADLTTQGAGLYAAPTARASVTASLTTGIRLASASTATAAITASLTTALQPASSSSARASVTAALTTSISLAASTIAQAQVSASLITAIRLAAITAARTQITADLSTTPGIGFVAVLGSSASVIASLTTGINLAALLKAQAQVDASLTTGPLISFVQGNSRVWTLLPRNNVTLVSP